MFVAKTRQPRDLQALDGRCKTAALGPLTTPADYTIQTSYVTDVADNGTISLKVNV